MSVPARTEVAEPHFRTHPLYRSRPELVAAERELFALLLRIFRLGGFTAVMRLTDRARRYMARAKRPEAEAEGWIV